jgi:parallel beta-helix repeat protein
VVSIVVLFILINLDSGSATNLEFESDLQNVNEEIIIYVDDDNILGPWDGTLEHPYRYIDDAYIASEDGYTIYVLEGDYFDITPINKSIKIIGDKQDKTIIHGGLYLTSNNIIITNLTINHYYYGEVGIYILSSNNNIKNNKILGCDIGIHIEPGSYNNTIEKNLIDFSHLHGIYLNSCNNTIKNNLIQRSEISGIEIVYYSTDNLIFNNLISTTVNGIRGYGSEKNIIENNLILLNIKGINLLESNGNHIIGNTIIFNFNGISIEASELNIINKNNCLFNFKPFSSLFLISPSDLKIFRNFVYGNFARPSMGFCIVYEMYGIFFPIPIIYNLIFRIIPYKGFNLSNLLEGIGSIGDFK